MDYWTKVENRVVALKYLFEEDLKWNIDDIKEKLTWSIFKERGLGTLHTYHPSLYEIVNLAYPNSIKEWELQHSEVPSNFSSKKSIRKKAVKWLVAEKLKLNPSEALAKLNKGDFLRYGLTDIFHNYYNRSVKKAINDAFEYNFNKHRYKK